MKPLVEIIIPTFNNLQCLSACLDSINRYTSADYRLNLVENGRQHLELIQDEVFHRTYRQKENLGWTRGINFMRDKVEGDFILMLNDDTLVLDHDSGWLHRMLQAFRDDSIAAVGPISNYAMGLQGLQARGLNHVPKKIETPLLSGFCMLVRRKVLDEVDWLDENFQDGAEDVDLSFKMRDAGYRIGICRDVFIYHIGSVTATRVHGSWWNSREYSDEHIMKIMRKWGVKKYYDMIVLPYQKEESVDNLTNGRKWAKSKLNGGGKIVELGPGPFKLIPTAIGIDKEPGGKTITQGRYRGKVSTGDVVGDIEKGLPWDDSSVGSIVGSHIFEHIQDPVFLLHECWRILKPDGKLVLLMPDQDATESIPLDPTHLHAWNTKSLESLAAVTGFDTEESKTFRPDYEFGICFRAVKP